jgi:hypothetical protein
LLALPQAWPLKPDGIGSARCQNETHLAKCARTVYVTDRVVFVQIDVNKLSSYKPHDVESWEPLGHALSCFPLAANELQHGLIGCRHRQVQGTYMSIW